MLIVGCGGLALQMIDDLENQFGDQLIFWSDINPKKSIITEKYKILKSDKDIEQTFYYDNRFILAIGNPANRQTLYSKFITLTGRCTSLISSKAYVSRHSNILEGNVILQNAVIEAGVNIGIGCLINVGAVITHECNIGEFCEIGPQVMLSGNVMIGGMTFVGASATVLPKLSIGSNAIVGAKALVTKNVADKKTVVGIPAKSQK